MAISFKKYVDIVSAVGGAAAATTRELIGRLFTENPLMPMNTTIEFTTLAGVKAYFGVQSEEYKRALFYFSFIGKQVTSPKKISFHRWTSVDTAPVIIGGVTEATHNNFTGVAAGSFELEIGGVTNTIDTLDFTLCTNMDDVAAVIQARINSFVGLQWTGATVVWEAANKRFVFTGGQVELANTCSISIGDTFAPPFLLVALGWAGNGNTFWLPTLPRFIYGAVHAFASSAFAVSADENNNFGSFLFMGTALTDEERKSIALDNDARNNEFMYTMPALFADYEFFCDELMNEIGGWCLTLLDGNVSPPPVDEYPEMMPMVILAATDYNRPDASQNYMFQRAALTPVITATGLSDFADACRANYYGATQQAGRLVSFYQRGYMHGADNDAVDMNTYANEMWLKDHIGVDLINLLLALGKISANRQGRATVLAAVNSSVTLALFNGVISIGKLLTMVQKEYITSVSGNPDAWRQVQDSGYWLDCFIEQMQNGDYKARYILIYSKDDAIRKIEGSHILI